MENLNLKPRNLFKGLIYSKSKDKSYNFLQCSIFVIIYLEM